MCYLELSSPLIWLFLFDRKTAGQLTRQRRTPAAPNAPLSMETCACFDSSQLFVPSLLFVEHWSMWRPLALKRQATWFPHISSLSFPCGQPCQQHSVAWEGSETSEVVGFGEEAWISSPGWPRPNSPSRVFASELRSGSVHTHTQSSLCSAFAGHSRHRLLQRHDPCSTAH